MYCETSRLQYNLQGVVSFQTAFSKKINSACTVLLLYHKKHLFQDKVKTKQLQFLLFVIKLNITINGV